MVIPLEDMNNANTGQRFIGSRPRVASATGVRLIGSGRLIACSLKGQRMYLIRYDLAHGTYERESCIATTYHGRDVRTDLVDFNGEDLLVTSNCTAQSVSLYRLVGNQLFHEQDLPIPDSGASFCHGARFVPGAPDIVCATCIRNAKRVYFISIRSGQVIYQFDHDGWSPHDVCFVGDGRLIMICQKGSPTKAAGPDYGARAAVIAFDLARNSHEVLSETDFPGCHSDTCAFSREKIYMNNQMRDTVIACSLVGNRIIADRHLSGYSFPHGLDVSADPALLAVTNYGDNSIVLTQL